MKEKFKQKLIGLIIGLVLLAASGTFIWYISLTGMVPFKYLIIGSVAFALLILTVVLLCININKTWRSLIGCLLSFVILALQFFAVDFIGAGTKALEQITNIQVEYAEVGVFVRADDPAEHITDLDNYKFGVLKSLDRNVTDKAIENVIGLLGGNITVAEHETIDEAADALLNLKEIDAIIVNKAFLDLLIEIEGYEDALDKIREVYISVVEDSGSVPNQSTGGSAYYPEGPLETGTYVAPNPTTKMPDHVISLYIGGIDCYGSISRRSRSDVNILAVINTKTKQVLLISTPRDFYVKTPVSGDKYDKLTNAAIYGTKVSRGALELLFDVEIKYQFKVNFTGFEKIVNSLGGITVYSKYTFTNKNGYSYVKGYNDLNGVQALEFARERYSFASGDRQRGKNQMEVIKGVIDKITSVAFLTNYKKVLDSVASSMETNVPYELITELINEQLNTGDEWNVATYSVDGTGASKKPYSQKGNSYVMIPKESTIEKAKSLINQIINDEVPTP